MPSQILLTRRPAAYVCRNDDIKATTRAIDRFSAGEITRLERTGVALPQFGLACDTLTRFGWRLVTASRPRGAVPVDAGSWSEEWAVVTDQRPRPLPRLYQIA